MRKVVVVIALCVVIVSAGVFHSTLRRGGKVRRRSSLRADRWNRNRSNGLLHLQRKAVEQQPVGDYFDDLYLVNVTYGTPPQEFSLILDTSESQTWLIDASCKSPTCTGRQIAGYTKHQFNASQSSSYVQDEANVTIGFWDWYEVFGDIGSDTFGIVNENLTGQALFLVKNLDEDDEKFGYLPADGVLGLGPSWVYSDHPELVSILDTFLPRLDAPMFTVWYDRVERDASADGGMVTYGALDTVHCSPTVQWAPLAKALRWLVDLQRISFGNESFVLTDQRYVAAVDTYNSYVEIGEQYAGQIASALGAWRDTTYSYFSYFVNCTVIDTAPPLVFTLNGFDLSIPADEYIVDESIGNGICELKISDLGSGSNLFTFGAPLLRTYCVTIAIDVTNNNNNTVGFAVANHEKTLF